MIYQWKEGSRFSVPAAVAGAELERISRESGGHVLPSAVVDAARSPDAPLHPVFEWDDSAAAEAHRREQARRLLRSVRLVTGEGDDKRDSIAFVHVELSEEGNTYVTTARAFSDTELEAQMLSDAVKLLKGVQERYQHLSALKSVFAAIQQELERVEIPQPKRRRKNKPALAVAS